MYASLFVWAAFPVVPVLPDPIAVGDLARARAVRGRASWPGATDTCRSVGLLRFTHLLRVVDRVGFCDAPRRQQDRVHCHRQDPGADAVVPVADSSFEGRHVGSSFLVVRVFAPRARLSDGAPRGVCKFSRARRRERARGDRVNGLPASACARASALPRGLRRSRRAHRPTSPARIRYALRVLPAFARATAAGAVLLAGCHRAPPPPVHAEEPSQLAAGAHAPRRASPPRRRLQRPRPPLVLGSRPPRAPRSPRAPATTMRTPGATAPSTRPEPSSAGRRPRRPSPSRISSAWTPSSPRRTSRARGPGPARCGAGGEIPTTRTGPARPLRGGDHGGAPRPAPCLGGRRRGPCRPSGSGSAAEPRRHAPLRLGG